MICLPANLLEIEITESAYAEEYQKITGVAEQLRSAGFTVLMDDFGSGYSSFNTLKDMDVDVLKIDMGFLRTTRPERIERSMSIINTIISLTKTLGLSVITEGVETKEMVDFLVQEDCDELQGYYYYKPLEMQKFEALIA